MSTIKCLIVDDEPIGREIIENFAKKINFLEVVAVCEDAFDALDILQKHRIDLLLTDIQMPQINGLELVSSLPFPPVIIFITAHDEFAINSFELGVADYLLKPVSFERFIKAINKARIQIEMQKAAASLNLNSKSTESIFIKVSDRLEKIKYNDILYLEAAGDYLKIHITNNKTDAFLITYSTIKSMQEKLPPGQFVRIHNSYLVPINAIKAVIGNMVELINGQSLTISKSGKEKLFTALQINNNS